VTGAEADAAARLLERLLTDPTFRAGFRRDPVGASREAGLESIAEEMALSGGKAMDTLDMRESRSSLAGVLLAAAFEGVGVYELSRDFLPHLDAVPESVGQVLSRVDLPAVSEAQAATPRGDVAAPAAEVAAPPAAAASYQPPAFAVPSDVPQRAGEFRAIDPDQAAGSRSTPEVPEAQAAGASSDRIDPAEFGVEGTGGQPSPEAVALLDDKHVALDPDAIKDLRSGKIDPRVATTLAAVGRDHDISVSAMMSDHDKLTTGGSVSNHYVGRAADIATVDGQPVSPSNQAARQVAEGLSRLPASIRPSEIGSPWALSGPAYFTDGAHQNHIHIGFDDPIAPTWKPPEDLAASGDAALPDGADAAVPAAADVPPDLDEDADDGGESDDEDEEPGGLEDPGGDTDAEADEESDGDDDDNDSISDDPSDEEEDEEDEDDESDGDDESDDGLSADGESDDGDVQDSDDSDDDDSDDEDDDDSDTGDTGDAGGTGGAGIDLGDVDGSYPGDDASKQELAAWMGSAAQKRGLPPELPVMASLVESGLRNVNYGDADSVGFFQMRVGIWNTGAYAGYPEHPERQLKWFLDQALAVKRQRLGSGQSVTDPGSYGEWVADVERPAAEFRGRYQLRLQEAEDLLKQGMESRPRGGRGDGAGAELDALGGGNGRQPGPRALEAVATARKYLGTPYQWGGSTPQTGFDCSGLVQYAYAKAGIKIPRTSETQILASNGRPVDRKHLIPGDLVFFRDSSGDVHHVGISIGGDKFINAPHTGDVVKVASLDDPYYAGQFTGGRRFDLSGARSAPAEAARAVAAGAEPAPAAGIDPEAVRDAEAALARDAAEVQRPGTLLFEAVKAQEIRKANVDAEWRARTQFLKTVEPRGAGAS
jgi:NlpC/P60 family